VNSHDGRVKLITMVLMCAVVLALVAAAAPAATVDIHGFMLNRFYVKPGEAHFEVERIGLQASTQLAPDVKPLVEWYYHYWAPTDKLWLESAYVDFTNKRVFQGGTLRAGRGRLNTFEITPSYGNRKTSEYGLFSETFTLDRVDGIQYLKPEKNGWWWGLSVFNGYALGTRPTMDIHVLEHAANPHLTDRENSKRDTLEYAAKISKQVMPSLNVGVSARVGKLAPSDVQFLQDNFNQTWTSRTKWRFGPDATFRKKPWIANAELIFAKSGELDYRGWEILAGYEPLNPNGTKGYVRYGRVDQELSLADYNPGVPSATSALLAADHSQWMLSVVQPIRPGVWLQIEYLINDQETVVPGTVVPQNDVGFIELDTVW
jgi:hypothetical protein